jgi:hypothetical protein
MGSSALTSGATKDRASRPGPSGRSYLIIGVFAVLVAVLGVGTYGLTQGSHPSLAATASQLLKQRFGHQVDQTVVGTIADPALTIEGDYVEVDAPKFSVLTVVNGPVVPGEGLPNQMSFTTCTWTISFSHVVGRVPVSVADWDTINHSGTVFKPYLVPGERRPPSFLLTGQHFEFQIRAVMPVGEGLMRWAPDGNHIVAKWDYQVEND